MLQRVFRGVTAAITAVLAVTAARADESPEPVAKTLASMDVWILAQPKYVAPIPGVTFDLAQCRGMTAWAGKGSQALQEWTARRLAETSGVQIPVLPFAPQIMLTLADTPDQYPARIKMDGRMLAQMGDQGYTLVIDGEGVTLTARKVAGLRNAVTTLAQIATDRTKLPGMVIFDWPSMKYRGAQQDVSRGQVANPEAIGRLADALALAKMNLLELYIEHVYAYKAFPDVAPPEGYTAADGMAMSAHAADAGVEIHPLLQGLGHSYHILNKPQYQHLRIGPCEKQPWIMTFDIRKPEAVQMVTTMIDELCATFPGELFNIDITEIDIDGLQADGVSMPQATDLVFAYVLRLNDAVKKHGRRLMITQGPLDSQGHLAGMGPKLDALPKDIIIGSYYCAGGPYQPAWEKDFPRLHGKGIDFFAQPWIYSHVWLTPWVNHAAEFSELEVSRGAAHGALGSVTTDWGDAGHFHFVGEEWLPFLYHGAVAWTGARLDRDYFRKAYARLVYGLDSDAAVRAMEAASDVNAKLVRVRDKDGKEVDVSTSYIWEFMHDPFTHPDITRLVDPAGAGQAILTLADPALVTLRAELLKARRNRDNLEQWVFGARCYAALGHKLIALGHVNDTAIPRAQAAQELIGVAAEFEALQTEFKRLWLAEDRDNDGFQELVKRFTYTSVACREKAKALQSS